VAFPDAPNHKLETLREFLGISVQGVAHRAMADVLTTREVLRHIIERSGRSLEALCSIEKMVIHNFPWGKHEGKPLRNAPKGYRDWLLKQDIDPNLRYSLEEVGKLDIPLPAPRMFNGKPKIVIPKRVIK
jgi:DNA polymerase-3 subunit epsilon